MSDTLRTASSLLAALTLLSACGGTPGDGSGTPDPVSEPQVSVMGQAPLGNVARIPHGSEEPSAENGTDFGTWSAGTIGQPNSPKWAMFELRNESEETVDLSGAPFVEVTGPDAARFGVLDMCGPAVDPGASMFFWVSFDGMGERRRHVAEVRVHLAGQDYRFAVAGTTVDPSQH